MAYAAVMNQRKCVLLMKRLESVQPTVNQVGGKEEEKRVFFFFFYGNSRYFQVGICLY